MARKSTGKRTRFEVFKRDHFTCQYCGAQPPQIVLVVDHIVPVASGGDDGIDNLISACTPCNQGKAHNPLGLKQIRPDADLLYLEAQQEIAEHKRFRESVVAREEALEATSTFLTNAWHKNAPNLDWHPAEHVVLQMLRRYPAETVYSALIDVATKLDTGYLSDRKWLPYLWAVARNHAEQADATY